MFLLSLTGSTMLLCNYAEAITSSEYDLAPMGALFCEANFLLRVSFNEFRVVYHPR